MSGTASSSQLDRIIASCLVYLSVERNLSPRTLEAYRGDYRSFAASLGAGEAWRSDAKAAQEWLADANVAVSTKRRRAAALRVLYRFAEGEGELTRSLSGEIDLPRTRRSLPAVLRPDEVERLLVALAAPRDSGELATADAQRARALGELLYGSGGRVSEIVDLNLDGIDLAEGTVRLFGKGRRERVVPIGEPAADAVRTYLDGGRAAHARASARSGAAAPEPSALLLARGATRRTALACATDRHATDRHGRHDEDLYRESEPCTAA